MHSSVRCVNPFFRSRIGWSFPSARKTASTVRNRLQIHAGRDGRPRCASSPDWPSPDSREGNGLAPREEPCSEHAFREPERRGFLRPVNFSGRFRRYELPLDIRLSKNPMNRPSINGFPLAQTTNNVSEAYRRSGIRKGGSGGRPRADLPAASFAQ